MRSFIIVLLGSVFLLTTSPLFAACPVGKKEGGTWCKDGRERKCEKCGSEYCEIMTGNSCLKDDPRNDASLVEKIGKLLGELSSLKASIAQEQKIYEGLNGDEKLLQAQDRTIKSIEEQYKKDLPVYEQDRAATEEAWTKWDVARKAFVAKWGCWDPCKWELPKQQAAYDASSAEMAPLNAERLRLLGEDKALDERLNRLKKTFNLIKEGKETLTSATLEWSVRKKANSAKTNELIARYQELTKTYMGLAQKDQLSEECKQIAYSNERPVVVGGRVVGRESGLDFGVLNGAMEKAQHCLQRVRDGAK